MSGLHFCIFAASVWLATTGNHLNKCFCSDFSEVDVSNKNRLDHTRLRVQVLFPGCLEVEMACLTKIKKISKIKK